MSENLKAYTDPNNPPFPPKGKYAQWNGKEWAMLDIPAPIPTEPDPVEGYQWIWNGKEWVKTEVKPYSPSELEKAESYLQSTAWLFIDGIIDLYKNAAEIKAARAAAIEVMKAHKAELAMDAPDFK